jgi:hypothetical protein
LVCALPADLEFLAWQHRIVCWRWHKKELSIAGLRLWNALCLLHESYPTMYGTNIDAIFRLL